MPSGMSELTKKFKTVIAPLRKREESAAIKAATAYLAKDLSDRFRIFGADLRIDKPSAPRKAPARTVGVLVVDYGNKRILEVMVGSGSKVVRVDDLGNAQPTYTSEEIKEAREIAEQDGRVARLAKRKGVFVSDFGPERASDNARRIGLRYAVLGKDQSAELLAHVVVDLSAQRLVRIDEASAVTGSRR